MYIYVLTSSAIRTVKLLSRAWLFLTASKAGFILSFASCTTPDFFFFSFFFFLASQSQERRGSIFGTKHDEASLQRGGGEGEIGGCGRRLLLYGLLLD